MTKQGTVWACTLAALLFLLPLPAAAQDTGFDDAYYGRFRDQNLTLNVYNWGEYLSDGTDDSLNVNRMFEELTGIQVYYSTYATNEELYSKLRGGGASYDVIIPSDYMIGRMASEGMLAELNADNLPNTVYIDEAFRGGAYDPEDRYSVPYMWGYTGIIYNTELVDEADDPASWNILWNEKYLGQILMFSNPRDAFAVAQARSGYSLNTTDPHELEDCFEQLQAQKPLVQAYVMDEIFDKMLGGEAALAPYYAGDAVTMLAENDSLAFAVPREGTNVFVDALCIPAGSKKQEAAEMYINFLCEPEISAANAEYIGYATPNTKSLELLDEEITSDPIAYPPPEVLANGESFNELPRETNLLLDQLWTELLSSDENYSRMLVPVLLVLAVLLTVGIHVYRLKHRKKQKNYF